MDYIKVEKIDELYAALNKEDYWILNGGSDLGVAIKNFEGKTIIDISGIDELKYVNIEDDIVHIGSGIRHCDICSNDYAKANLAALISSSSEIGSKQIRNVGTIIGNVCNSSPGGDTPVVLECYEASVVIENDKKEVRTQLVSDFITGYRSNDLKKHEFVKEVFFKNDFNFSFFKKHGISHRNSVVIANASVAFKANINDGVLKDVNCIFGACSAKSMKMPIINEYFEGRELKDINEEDVINLFDSELDKMLSDNKFFYDLKTGHLKGIAADLVKEVLDYEKR